MTLLTIDRNLTGGDTEERRKQLQTHAGMAFFAATGPLGAHCAGCHSWSNSKPGAPPTSNQKSARCLAYQRLMHGNQGPAVPADARACKYYEQRAARS